MYFYITICEKGIISMKKDIYIRYSQLIQDCYYDLTDAVLSHEVKINQYVGDEVVLSWEIDKGIDHQNCLKTFFTYDDLLQIDFTSDIFISLRSQHISPQITQITQITQIKFYVMVIPNPAEVAVAD
jgi:hypothetical protein